MLAPPLASSIQSTKGEINIPIAHVILYIPPATYLTGLAAENATPPRTYLAPKRVGQWTILSGLRACIPTYDQGS